MIGVNSIHSSAGRLRSRSLCSVRYGRSHRGAETLCYGWPPRSRSLRPVLYTDLVVSRLQGRRKKKAVRPGCAPPGCGRLGGCEGGAGGWREAPWAERAEVDAGGAEAGGPAGTEGPGMGMDWRGVERRPSGQDGHLKRKGLCLGLLDGRMTEGARMGFRTWGGRCGWGQGMNWKAGDQDCGLDGGGHFSLQARELEREGFGSKLCWVWAGCGLRSCVCISLAVLCVRWRLWGVLGAGQGVLTEAVLRGRGQ